MPRISADDRKGMFLNAAVQVIAEHGVDGATTRRIAHQAGAPLASLHYCFGTKEQLFAALWEYQVGMMRDRVYAPSPGVGIGAAAAQLIRQIVDFGKEEEALARTNFELLLWGSRRDPAMTALGYDSHLAAIVPVLQSAATSDDDLSLIDALARFVVTCADNLALQWLCHHDEERIKQDTDTACRAAEALAAAS